MRSRGALPPLMLISDAARMGEGRFLEALRRSVEGGLRMVQLREPAWDSGRIRDLALGVLDLLGTGASRKVCVLVSRAPDLAVELGLEGVHVGGGRPDDVRSARSEVGPHRLVGYSAHSLDELLAAAREGADYGTYSPVFGAISKKHPLAPVGLEALRRVCDLSPVPVYALGGILPRHAPSIREAGAVGAGMIGGILQAPEPLDAVREFLRGWAGEHEK